jgi:hypothetical protein
LDITSKNSVFMDNPDQAVSAQWCVVTEGLEGHSKAMLLAGKWGSRVTLHHNLISNSAERMPEVGHWDDAINLGGDRKGTATAARPTGNLVDIRNNVMFNWGAGGEEAARTAASVTGAHMRMNVMHNFFKEGPESPWLSDCAFRVGNADARGYLTGNRWAGQLWTSDYQHVIFEGGSSQSGFSLGAALRMEHVLTDSAPLAAHNWKNEVLEKAGSSRWRDAVDRRAAAGVDAVKGKIIANVTEGMDYAKAHLGHGAADYEADGWPKTPPRAWPPNRDLDRDAKGFQRPDGMRDDWERLFLSDPAQSVLKFAPWEDLDGDGFTNLEEFLNKTHPAIGDDSMGGLVHSHVEGEL